MMLEYFQIKKQIEMIEERDAKISHLQRQLDSSERDLNYYKTQNARLGNDISQLKETHLSLMEELNELRKHKNYYKKLVEIVGSTPALISEWERFMMLVKYKRIGVKIYDIYISYFSADRRGSVCYERYSHYSHEGRYRN